MTPLPAPPPFSSSLATRCSAQLMQESGRQLVAVLASDGVTPIDVVSDANFFDIGVNDLNGTGVISSYAIDRVTQRPHVHMQRFQLAGNEHVVRAATAWKAALMVGAGTGEREMLTMHRWLTKRVLEAEASNPQLRVLKDKIAAASAAVDSAVDAPEPERRELLKALDVAVFELIAEVQRTPKP